MTRPQGTPISVSVETIRKWLASEVPSRWAGTDAVEDAMEWATDRWASLRTRLEPLSMSDPDLPDRLNALSLVAFRDQVAEPVVSAHCYRWLKRAVWPGSETFGERALLLARFAYVASRQFRRRARFGAGTSWEKRSIAWVVQQPAVEEFLAILGREDSEQLNRRFLCDAPMLLGACQRVRQHLNNAPGSAFGEAVSILNFLEADTQLELSSEERSYFVAQLELYAGLSCKNASQHAEARAWIERARCSSIGIVESDSVVARIEFARLSVAQEARSYSEALAGVTGIVVAFARLGMTDFVARSYLLEGMALKELGRDREALSSFRKVVEPRFRAIEPWLRGLALAAMAELRGRAGEYESAKRLLTDSWHLMMDSDVSTAIAYFHAVSAEILRGEGDLASAAECYRRAGDTWTAGGMDGLAAYVKVVLSETLLAAGKEAEAVCEIMTALPAIEKLKLMQEGIAAVALLRESLRRQNADPEALRNLRVHIENLRHGGQS